MGHRNREIDWLRAYAVLMVIVHHGALLLPLPNVWEAVVGTAFSGASGVDLFFVISGFVIAQSFLRRFDTAVQAGPRQALGSAIGFAKRRFRRLYPASITWALIILLATLLIGHAEPWLPADRAIRAFFANAVYLSNFNELNAPTAFGYYWSLALEMQFYLLLPVFLVCCRSDLVRVALLIGLVLASPLFMGFEGAWMFRVSGLALGVALYLLVGAVRWDPLANLAHHNRALTLGLLAGLVTVRVFVTGQPDVATLLACVMSFVLVYAASFERGHIYCLGRPQWLDWIGTRSYSLYLAHIPMMLINQAAWSGLLGTVGLQLGSAYWLPVLVTATLATGLAAEASYRFIELPFQGRRVATAPAQRVSDLVGVPLER
ncbi:MAG: acyltransferase family protein [Devosia sp.]